MKRLTFAFIFFALLGLGYYLVFHSPFSKSTVSLVLPSYEDSNQLASDIKLLPIIGFYSTKTTVSEWDRYILIAKRMKITRLDIIKSALQQVSNDRKPIDFSDRKMMLLLRVCFKCPSGKVQNYIQGAWMSYSAAQTKKHIRDVNWPVGEKFGHFYLEDTIDGYMGPPYDPVMDFQWRLANCKWRDL